MGADAGGVDPRTVAIVIPLLGIGTFALRYALIGLFHRQQPPEALRRVLRFVPAAVLPAIAAPLLFIGADGDFVSDPVRLGAAALGVAAGAWSRNLFVTIAVGMAAYWGLGALA